MNTEANDRWLAAALETDNSYRGKVLATPVHSELSNQICQPATAVN